MGPSIAIGNQKLNPIKDDLPKVAKNSNKNLKILKFKLKVIKNLKIINIKKSPERLYITAPILDELASQREFHQEIKKNDIILILSQPKNLKIKLNLKTYIIIKYKNNFNQKLKI